MDADVLWRDTEVAAAWSEDRVERESAFVLIRGIFSQIQDFVADGVERCLPPDGLNLHPQAGRTQRVWKDGRMRLINEETELDEPVISDELLSLVNVMKMILLISHTIDRSPTKRLHGFLDFREAVLLPGHRRRLSRLVEHHQEQREEEAVGRWQSERDHLVKRSTLRQHMQFEPRTVSVRGLGARETDGNAETRGHSDCHEHGLPGVREVAGRVDGLARAAE